MKEQKVKVRAKNNRTLTLSPEEYDKYERQLCTFLPEQEIKCADILNKTICNDLFEVVDKLPAGFADLIIIDPPYNLTKNFNGFKFSASDQESYLNYLRSWFPQVVSLLKPTGSLYLCGDWKCTAALHEIMNEHLHVLNRITWQREKGKGAKSNWKNAMEDIWFGVKDPKEYYFDVEAVKQKRQVIAPYKENGQPKDWEESQDGKFRLTHPSNFWDDISIPYWSMPENTDHPTQKAEKLIAKLILASCPEGGIVFDPFLGSGTTSVVAKKLNRHYCGIEMNKEYACWAEKRLSIAEGNSTIQGYADGVFWERNSLHLQKRKKETTQMSLFPPTQ